MTESELYYTTVGRNELGQVLRGKMPSDSLRLENHFNPRMGGRDVSVFWTKRSNRPCVICVADDDRQELFNWAVTFQSDLSPLTSWCHILSPKELDRIGGSGRCDPDLLGLEAAWAGAAIAEAMILSRRNFDVISLPVCLATDTYAIARTLALYGAKGTFHGTIERLDLVRDKLRRSAERWRPTSSLAIASLIRVLPDAPESHTRILDLLSRACRELHRSQGAVDAQSNQDQHLTAPLLREIIDSVPQLSELEVLNELSAEERVKRLREIKTLIPAAPNEDARNLLLFAAGYVMSRIGGAELDLRLADSFEADYPNVLTWATILGGLGAGTYWADAFGGIGRLVARELSRALYISEPPSADISADELLVIAAHERGINKFRRAQRTVATIAVRPGVVVQLGIADEDRTVRPDESARVVHRNATGAANARDQQLQTLARDLFPFLRPLLLELGIGRSGKEKRGPGKNKAPQLFKDK